jgi:phenylacetate-CoA ligase
MRLNSLQKPFLILSLLLNPFRSRKALLKMQNRKLRRLVRHAYAHYPYYRELFSRSGITPDDIRSEKDLRAIPVTGKEELRKAIRDFPGIPAESLWLSTSGSSGIPMRFPARPVDSSRMNISWLRPMLAHGVRPWHSRLEITGPHNIKKRQRWFQYFGFFKLNQLSVFAGEEQWLEGLNKNRPDMLWGYSRSLINFSRYLIGQNKNYHRPRWIFGVSELVDEQGRETIRLAFGRDLIDLYGAAETGCIAWQCPACGDYHMNIDSLAIEFLPDQANPALESQAAIVITNLHSYAFPIIRYAIGDLGQISPKEPICGRGLPLMTIIAGREDDAVVLPSGRKLSPLFFFAVLKKIPGLNQWRVTQDTGKGLRISVVAAPDASLSNADAEAIIRACIGEPIDIILETVPAIPPDPSGKQRSVIVK